MRQTTQAGSLIYKLARWFVALALTLFGSWFYIAAPLIGGGVHLDPMPGAGMLIAGGALLGIIGGYLVVRSEKRANILATIIEIVLAFGAISLLIGVFEWGYEAFYSVQSSEAAHSRPGAVLFRMSYGGLSVAAFLIFNKWIRKASVNAPR